MREPLRTLVLAILTALILAAPSFAQPEPGAESHLRLAANHRGGGAVVPVNRLMRAVKRSNLRNGPGTHYDKVGLLEVGQQVRVTGEAGDWLRVKTPSGDTAFVYAPLLANMAQPTAATRRQRPAPAPRAVRSIDEAHKAVWMMHNLEPGETFDKNNSGSSQKSVHVERDWELKSRSSIRYLGVSTPPRYPRGNSCSLRVWSRQRSNCKGPPSSDARRRERLFLGGDRHARTGPCAALWPPCHEPAPYRDPRRIRHLQARADMACRLSRGGATIRAAAGEVLGAPPCRVDAVGER